jgi:DNA ligase D
VGTNGQGAADGPATASGTPKPARAAKSAKGGAAIEVDVAGVSVRLSSPDKIYFPDRGYTKHDVFTYYLAVGDGILRALHERPTTLQRFPEGIDGEMFFQKRVPTRGVPPWVRTAKIEFPSGREADELAPADLAHVAWASQLGTIVFHPWPVRSADTHHPDELRLDLDPQPGTDFADAVTVAGVAHEVLDELGWIGYPKTSGGRGAHIYIRIRPQWTFVEVRRAAIAFAREIERRRPDLATTSWWKEERGQRVFLDFNQTARDRTIACAYSLRANPRATVSTPVTWDELTRVEPNDFDLRTVPQRFAEIGDPHAAIDDIAHDLTPLLEWVERDERDGLGDAPYPPDHPKMEGEPKRVQPSRARPD